MEFSHVPVLARQCIEGLNIRPDGVYVLVMVSDDEHAYRSTVILQR